MTSGCLARTVETHKSATTATKLDGGGAAGGERAGTVNVRRERLGCTRKPSVAACERERGEGLSFMMKSC
jgi:hypothetical protein